LRHLGHTRRRVSVCLLGFFAFDDADAIPDPDKRLGNACSFAQRQPRAYRAQLQPRARQSQCQPRAYRAQCEHQPPALPVGITVSKSGPVG
jgi:hypothetical protein